MQVELKVVTTHNAVSNKDYTNYVLNISGYDFNIKPCFATDERMFREVWNQLAKKENN